MKKWGRFLSLCISLKIIFFKKGLDKLPKKVFHRHPKKTPQKSLDFARFSTLSTEFSIGLSGKFCGGMENFLKNRAL